MYAFLDVKLSVTEGRGAEVNPGIVTAVIPGIVIRASIKHALFVTQLVGMSLARVPLRFSSNIDLPFASQAI